MRIYYGTEHTCLTLSLTSWMEPVLQYVIVDRKNVKNEGAKSPWKKKQTKYNKHDSPSENTTCGPKTTLTIKMPKPETYQNVGLITQQRLGK